METLTRNTVIHAVFEEMSKLLKEKEGIPNKAIAIDTGIDFGIFSKLLSGKKDISELYEHKIYNYFKQKSFEKYADHLKLKITKLLHLHPHNSLFHKLWKMSYESLLDYVFFEMNVDDIDFEHQLKSKFLHLLHNNLFNLIQTQTPHLHWISSSLSTTPNNDSPVEIQLALHNPSIYKIIIRIDASPEKHHLDPFDEVGNYYVHIRIDTSFLEHLYKVENIGHFNQQLITIETINMNLLYVEAHQLALRIYDKIRSAKDSFDISPKPIYTLTTSSNNEDNIE